MRAFDGGPKSVHINRNMPCSSPTEPLKRLLLAWENEWIKQAKKPFDNEKKRTKTTKKEDEYLQRWQIPFSHHHNSFAKIKESLSENLAYSQCTHAPKIAQQIKIPTVPSVLKYTCKRDWLLWWLAFFRLFARSLAYSFHSVSNSSALKQKNEETFVIKNAQTAQSFGVRWSELTP